MLPSIGLRIILSTFLSSALILTALGQKVIPKFETIGVNEGLSQNSVYSIIQDSKGFMWFGTSSGLNRYDGEHVKSFKLKNTQPGRANINYVRGNIEEDKTGRIWYANETGIYYVDPINEQVVQWINLLSDSGIPLVYYHLITLDENEDLWLLVPAKGIIKYSIKNKNRKAYDFPEFVTTDNYIMSFESHHNFIYLRTNNSTNIRFDINSNNSVTYSAAIDSNVLMNYKLPYMIDQNKLIIEGEDKELFEVAIRDKINEVMSDDAGRIWIGSSTTGLYCYYPENGLLENFQHDNSKLNSISFNIITCLYKDATDNLWIGTDGGGISKLNLKQNRFGLFPVNASDYPLMKDYFIRCIYEDTNQIIWFGTQNNGLCKYDPKTEKLKCYINEPDKDNSIATNKVNAIFKDNDGNMWVGHGKGFSLFNEIENSFKNLTQIKQGNNAVDINNVYKIVQLNNEEILVGSDAGLLKFSTQNKLVLKELDNRILPTDILLLSDGSLWITTREKGLNYISKKDGAELKKRFFTGIYLRSAHIDKKDPDILWLCSGAGIIRFNSKTYEYKIYNEDNGLPDNDTYGILEDTDGNFWASSNSGIFLFNQHDIGFRNFTFKDGLQSNEFNARAFHEGGSGKFYFGGINGFNYFDPIALKTESIKPKVSIVSIQVNDKLQFLNSNNQTTIKLRHHENDLSFSFAVLEFTRPEANKIQYKLDNWDKDYITSLNKNIRYSNLPPGEYQLKVKGSTDGENWSEDLALKIEIETPFWMTYWFYSSLTLLFVALIFLATRFYYKQKVSRKIYEMEKQHAILLERNRISQDIHDDLGAGLSSIVIISELINNKNQPKEFTENQLNKISEISRGLINNFNELIWSHNTGNDSLEKLLWYLRERLGNIFDNTATNFNIEFSENITDRPIQAVWRRNVYLIIKEALHNILKHANAKNVSLKISVVESLINVTIVDDGIGFSSEEKSKGNGLNNMKKRADVCSGKLIVESNGQGTKLVFTAPLL